jgi:Protein of unknown function (DUF2635).
MTRIFIKPAVAGQIIRHPQKLNYRIKQEGEWVKNSREWERMLLQGDIVLAQPPVVAPAKQQEKQEKPAVKQKEINKQGREIND